MGIVVHAPNGDEHALIYDNKPIENKFNSDGSENPRAYSIPYTDPRRKTAMSMVKKLVRVNAGRVITPIEFLLKTLG